MAKNVHDRLETEVGPYQDKPISWISQFRSVRLKRESSRWPEAAILTGSLWLPGRPDRSALCPVRLRHGRRDMCLREGRQRSNHQGNGKNGTMVRKEST